MTNFLRLLASLFSSLVGVASYGRTFRFKTKVARWRTDIRQVQFEENTSFDERVILSIIQVESEGNENAHRPGAQYYGLTQVGKDVAGETRTNRHNMVKRGREGGREGIRAFVRWAVKYEHLHQGDGERMAIGWKGGVGTLTSYNRQVKFGVEPSKAVKRWLNVKRWRTWKYVRWYRASFSIWSSDVPATASKVTVR